MIDPQVMKLHMQNYQLIFLRKAVTYNPVVAVNSSKVLSREQTLSTKVRSFAKNIHNLKIEEVEYFIQYPEATEEKSLLQQDCFQQFRRQKQSLWKG